MNYQTKTRLLIFGVYPESEGYPNIKYRLEDLAKLERLSIETLHIPIWPNTISNQQKSQRLKIGARFITAHLIALYKFWRTPDKTLTYIPYPAVLLSFLLSWLPKKYQPERLLVDAFISLYDTICLDRTLLSPKHPLARLLFWIERRAYQYATHVIVDTEQNAEFLSQLFKLPREKFVAIPLSTNENELAVAHEIPPENHSTHEILFVGTLIPLHGVEVILGAIKLLADNPKLHFKIIGNGQQAPLIEAFIQTQPGNLSWIREWQSQTQLFSAIRGADICLGIFGSTAKAQRVCPLKIYHYAASGRPIITAETDWMRANVPRQNTPALVLVPPGSPEALANAINALIAEPKAIEQFAQASKKFYQAHLSNQQAMQMLIKLF